MRLAPADASYPLQVGYDLLNGVSQAIDTSCLPLPDMCGARTELVNWGPPDVISCPLLAVYIIGAGKDQASSVYGNSTCVWRDRLVYRVEYWVCVPIPDATSQVKQEVNELVYQHIWQAYHGTMLQFKEGNIRGIDLCDAVVFGDMTPFPNQGGCGGAQFQVTLTL